MHCTLIFILLTTLYAGNFFIRKKILQTELSFEENREKLLAGSLGRVKHLVSKIEGYAANY
jgi:hypothetical protein